MERRYGIKREKTAMIILAIETSCDETSVAILKATTVVGSGSYKFEILSNVVLSQIKTHAKWGGVVPSLAKREHQANLIPILIKALRKSNLLIFNSQFSISKQTTKNKLQKIKKTLVREPELLKQFLEFIPKIKAPKINAIAVTVGPGLEPALWVGINFAKALSLVWNKPIIAVNHMEGHIAAVFLQNSGISKHQFPISKQTTNSKIKKNSNKINFPALALLVSGGHTELALIKKWGNYKIIGQTRDDAVGECFDKTARMLELPYPGGPQIAKQAENYKKYPLTFRMGGWTRREMEKEAFNIKLPRPMIHSHDFDFSFSGLKTAVLYMLRDMKENHVNIGDFTPMICNEIQQSIIDVLISKTIKVAKEFGAQSIILGGGVAANKELRAQMKKAVVRELAKTTALYLPPIKLTTDNAAMIGAAGYLRASKKDFAKIEDLKAQGNLLL